MAPAKAPRLAKWVRFGAAPATSAAPSMPLLLAELLVAALALDEVAGRAGAAGTAPWPACASSSVGTSAPSSWFCLPGLVVGRREGDDAHPHVGVGQAAELRALAAVHAGLVGLDEQRVLAAGDGVALAVERRDPERVDDVARLDAESDTGSPAGITRSLAVTMSSVPSPSTS